MPELEEFLEHLEKERNVSPHTLKAYRRDLGELLAFLGQYYGEREWTWQGVDRLALRGFLSHLNRRKLSKRSISRALSAVRSFYAFMNRNEMVDANPARGVSSPKLEKYLPGYLDRAQIDLLFQSAALHAQDGKFTDVRNSAILELFYSTGMRLSELRGINRSDIDLLSQQVKVRGKGRKERIIPVGDHASLALRNYESKRDDLIRNMVKGADRTAHLAHRDSKCGDGLSRSHRRGRGPVHSLASPHFCNAPARRGSRPASRSGAAWPRVHFHDADLHAY